jgi:hypothetical protein
VAVVAASTLSSARIDISHISMDSSRIISDSSSVSYTRAAPECAGFDDGLRRHRAGIQSRELGVLFKDLHVVGLGAAASYQTTFDSVFNPKIILENFRTMRHPPLRDILTGFEGVLQPGEMLRP